MAQLPCPPEAQLGAFQQGLVIPAHPLALTPERKLDERHQRALTRYYLDAGAGGLAVGVHSTQFEIRDPQIGYYEPVLTLASEETDRYIERTGTPVVKIAGVVGRTEQALQEAELAKRLGYHAVLLGLKAFGDDPNEVIIQHCRTIADVMPLIGFYLQPAVGGRYLDAEFWRAFAEIDNVIGIKVAPFNRYHTLDVFRGVAASGRHKQIALYTGNDDNIVADLLTPVEMPVEQGSVTLRFVGGLLGHWAVWTHNVAQYVSRIKAVADSGEAIPPDLLTLGARVTDCNAAIFDVAHRFEGVIVGMHEILRRQGLLQGVWTLNPKETLKPAQKREIDRVIQLYPELNDDAFVRDHLDEWLA
jgi:hypothetical protein